MKVKAILSLAAAFITSAAMTVTGYAYDLTTVSDITPDELLEYMHPETRHLAADVVRICREQEISAEFIATVMRWERRTDLNNYFGWTTDAGNLMRFDSDIECLEIIIPRIKSMYLSPSGKYFNGYTVEAVSLCYNDTDFWRDKIDAGTMWIVREAG